MTSQPSAWAHRTHGALSATATIDTTIPSHHASSQLPTPPHEPPGTAPATPAVIFTHRIHHHLVSTLPHTPCQSTLSKWSTTRRGSPPQNPSFIPRPLSTTMRHMPPFDPFWQATFLKRQLHPVDTHQDPLHQLFTLHLPLSATVVPFDGLDRNSAPSGVLPDLVKNSHAYLGDIFNGGCNHPSCI